MKNIYDEIIEIKIEGISKDWENTSIWNHYVLLSEEERIRYTEEFRFPTFQDCYNQVKAGLVSNSNVSGTLFRNRPQVCISSAMRDYTRIMTEKNYKPVRVRVSFKLRKDLSMDFLMKNLSAEDFSTYIREHNLIMCPLNTSKG